MDAASVPGPPKATLLACRKIFLVRKGAERRGKAWKDADANAPSASGWLVPPPAKALFTSVCFGLVRFSSDRRGEFRVPSFESALPFDTPLLRPERSFSKTFSLSQPCAAFPQPCVAFRAALHEVQKNRISWIASDRADQRRVGADRSAEGAACCPCSSSPRHPGKRGDPTVTS